MTYSGQAARILLQVVSVVVLARLLAPADYGLLAMVLAVVGIGEIFRDFGLSSAAIQAKNLTGQQKSNLFWVNTAIGFVLAGIVFATAPLLAGLYGRPELVAIAQVLSLTFIINGVATQFRADLSRRLKFKNLVMADVSAPAVGLVVAVFAALAGWQYWALVAQQLTQVTVVMIGVVIGARWRPGLPRKTPGMRSLLRFGTNLVATQLVGYLSNNLDSVVIGTRFGAASLGIYNRGFQLLMAPLNQLRAPTTTVALPILSRLSDSPAKYDQFIARGQLALGYSLVVGLGLVIGAAEPLTDLMLGERWLEVAPILRLLAAAGVFQTLAYVGYWVYLSRGLTTDLFRYSLVSATIKVTCILVGSIWGVIGVAVGYALAPALAWPLSLFWLSRRTQIPLRQLLFGALRVLTVTIMVAGGAAGASLLVAGLGSLAQVIAAVTGGILLYVLVAATVPMFRRDAIGIIEIGKMIPKERRAR